MKRAIGIYGQVPLALLSDERVKPNMIRVYVALSSYQGTSDKCWPGIQGIAERAGIPVNAVSAATEALEKSGWIEKRRRANERKTTMYRVLVDIEGIPISEESGYPENPEIARFPENPEIPLYENNQMKTTTATVPVAKSEPYSNDFEDLWKLYPRKIEKKKSLRAYTARRREGSSHDDLLTATKNYAEACKGKDQKYIKHAATFFGPDEPWRDYTKSVSPGSSDEGNSGEVLVALSREEQREKYEAFIGNGGKA